MILVKKHVLAFQTIFYTPLTTNETFVWDFDLENHRKRRDARFPSEAETEKWPKILWDFQIKSKIKVDTF